MFAKVKELSLPTHKTPSFSSGCITGNPLPKGRGGGQVRLKPKKVG